MKSQDVPRFVDDLMTVDLIAVRPDERIGRARELFLGLGINALPILDEGEVRGIVTSRDLVEEWPDGEPIRTAMSSAVRTIDAGASVGEAASVMLEEHVHHLVVFDGDQLAGIVSSFDLLVPLAQGARFEAPT